MASPPQAGPPVVSVVLVAHDGARWLGDTLAAVAVQTRPPDRCVAVDTGSRDASAELLRGGLGADAVRTRPRRTGYGEAVAHGVAGLPAAGPGEWLWLLHDDSAPAPGALEALLDTVEASPSVAVAGPKVLGWYDRRLLLEVGVTVAGSGRRETGLERREQDQGQHDGVRDVLAVGSAGMLVRRDVWEELGGFDPALTLYRDDLDLGWRARRAGHRVVCVTDAVVHHAEATTRGRRRGRLTRARRPHLLDRRSALHVLLANSPAVLLPFLVLRLLAGTLLRSAGYLLGKLPHEAADEIGALAAVVLRPDRVVAARRDRRRMPRSVPHREVRRLLAPPSAQLRHLLDGVTDLVPVTAPRPTHPVRTPAETGPTAAEADDLVPPSAGPSLRRLAAAPGVLLVLVLVVLGVVAGRGLVGRGALTGGALLPVQGGARDLAAAYAAAWHPVGLGTGTAAPPWLGLLAAGAVPLLGSVGALLRVLLVAGVPLAGLSAYLCSRGLVGSRLLRVWAALVWAGLPALTGAVAAGRVGTVVVAVLVPPLAVAARRCAGSWRAAAAAAALLTVGAAFVPLLWVVAAPVAAVTAAASRGAAVRRLRPLLVLAVPAVVLLPWSALLARHPRLLLTEAGFAGPGLSEPSLDPAAVLLVHPGGPGGGPVWWSAGLLLVALVALLRRDRRRLVAGAWGLALAATAGGILVSRAQVPTGTGTGEVAAWPGVPTLVVALGLLVAAVVGAEGLRDRVAGVSFGWRQPVAVALVAAAVAAPVLSLVGWAVRGADDPVRPDRTAVLPAFVAAEALGPDRPRTLVLAGSRSALRLAVLRGDGPRLGDADLLRSAGESGADPLPASLTSAAADLASARGGDVAARLAAHAVGYVQLAPSADPALVRAVDGAPGLSRASTADGEQLWRVAGDPARLRLLGPGPSADDSAGRDVETVVASGDIGGGGSVDAGDSVDAGEEGRLLVLAERADDRWRASLDGDALTRVTVDGWAQGFAVPASGGTLSVAYDAGGRRAVVWLQGAALVALVVLALPGARRAQDEDDAPMGRRSEPGRRRRR